MSLDDFEPSEFEDNDEYEYEDNQEESTSDSESIKDKYDRYKQSYDKYKEKYDNYQKKHIKDTSNELPKPDTQQFRRVASQARNEQIKNTGKEVAKEGVKSAAKKTGKEVAKEGAKVVTKEGAKTAVEAGLSATGVGVVAAAAIEAADKLAQKLKALADKKYREQEKEKAKKKRRKLLIIFGSIFFLVFILFVVGPMYTVSEEATTTMEQIIANREKRNTEKIQSDKDVSEMYKKTLMTFTDDEYDDLLFKNYDKIEGTKPTQYEDPSYNYTVKNNIGTDIVNFFAKSEDLKDKDEFEISTKVAGKIIKSETNNFNKIKWQVTDSKNAYSFESLQKFSSVADMQANDKKPTYSGGGATSEITDLEKIPYTDLKVPNLSVYDIDPSTSNKADKAYTYVEATADYLQKWYIPYTMMIDTQDKKFILDEIMEKMYHPIDFTLYQLCTEKKNTTTQYYLETTITKTWQEYIQYKTISPEGKVLKTDQGVIVNKEEEIGKSNTKDSTVGVDRQLGPFRIEQLDSYIDKDGNTVKRNKMYANQVITTALTDGGVIAKDENGEPMVESITITRNFNSSRYIPKITHAETFYEIINSNYKVNPIDENSAPRTKEESGMTLGSSLLGNKVGIISVTETWEETLTAGTYESKPYQVSYYSKDDLEKLNKKVSRVEWYQDWGDTEEVLEAIKTGDYSSFSAAATSENMVKLLEQAAKMCGEDRWTYNQGGDRGVCTTLEQLYSKSNIDCSSFVSSLYNIFLGVNPGSWTR